MYSTSLQERPWLEVQIYGSSECRLLKAESGWEYLGNHRSWDKAARENRNLQTSVFLEKQRLASNDPKHRESFKERRNEQCKKNEKTEAISGNT